MSITDKRMLDFRDILKQTRRIRFYTEFDEKLGILKSNLSKIRSGKESFHFTVHHIKIAVNDFGANANYLFGVSDEVFRKK
ncbi:hypothetical protein C8J95_102324 [Elizabethkingia sp. YR214]|uniref:hypothetical protein n=1 Tax=Elizabethkingia sp. YR214 TaxID=2135667 RepID=UPI000D306109|nr:hypothetical protein [Elizabethkingia sp. YR214]PUB34658.1 hypothetical protein C8J95_102324 [Elizabethkingia sp. YR214]